MFLHLKSIFSTLRKWVRSYFLIKKKNGNNVTQYKHTNSKYILCIELKMSEK